MNESPIAAGPYRIHRLRGEFADPAVEAAYQHRTTRARTKQVRGGLLFFGLFFLAFIAFDHLMLGESREFYLLLAVRVSVVALIVWFALSLSRRPGLLRRGYPLALLEVAGFTAYFTLYFLMPPSVHPWLTGMMMALLVGVFVAVPNRLPLTAAVIAYAATGTLLCVELVDEVPLVVTALFMLAPALAGLLLAYRLQVTRRAEYAALQLAASANEELRREVEVRRRLEAELKLQATTDPLTGLYNRRHYEALFEQEWKRTRRSGGSLALAVLDLDHFKSINDTYGHAAGDEALRQLAALCRSELRGVDVVGRLGGEEFVLLLPEAGLEDGRAAAERLRCRLEAQQVVAGEARFRVTATVGVTAILPGDAGVNDLIRRADEALYAGKRLGRNRVETA